MFHMFVVFVKPKPYSFMPAAHRRSEAAGPILVPDETSFHQLFFAALGSPTGLTQAIIYEG